MNGLVEPLHAFCPSFIDKRIEITDKMQVASGFSAFVIPTGSGQQLLQPQKVSGTEYSQADCHELLAAMQSNNIQSGTR